MEPSLQVAVSELYTAAARLHDAGQRLQDGLSNVDLQVRETLGSGWRGDAASAFGSAWEQWHDGAGQVIHAVHVMSGCSRWPVRNTPRPMSTALRRSARRCTRASPWRKPVSPPPGRLSK